MAGCGAELSGVWRAERDGVCDYVYLPGDEKRAITARARQADHAFDVQVETHEVARSDGNRALRPGFGEGEATPFRVNEGALTFLGGELEGVAFEWVPAYRHRSLTDKMTYALYRKRHGFSNEELSAWVK
jgi:hypothetical protein